MGNNDRIKEAMRKVRVAERNLENIMHEEYPSQSYVRWDHHGYRQSGEVIRRFCGGRIKVLNEATGCERWITAHDIVIARP